MSGGRVWGRLNAGGKTIPIRDRDLALWVQAVVEREPLVREARNQLDVFRKSWPLLRAEAQALRDSSLVSALRRVRLLPEANQAFLDGGGFEAWADAVEMVTRDPGEHEPDEPSKNGGGG